MQLLPLGRRDLLALKSFRRPPVLTNVSVSCESGRRAETALLTISASRTGLQTANAKIVSGLVILLGCDVSGSGNLKDLSIVAFTSTEEILGSKQSTSLLLVLARCEQGMVDLLRPALNDLGVSLEQWRVICTLRQVEYLSMTALSDLAAVSASSLTRHVDQLIDMSAALRQVDPVDRRKVVVALTKRGRRLADKCAKAEEDCLVKAMDPAGKTGRNLAELIEFVEIAPADT